MDSSQRKNWKKSMNRKFQLKEKNNSFRLRCLTVAMRLPEQVGSLPSLFIANYLVNEALHVYLSIHLFGEIRKKH